MSCTCRAHREGLNLEFGYSQAHGINVIQIDLIGLFLLVYFSFFGGGGFFSGGGLLFHQQLKQASPVFSYYFHRKLTSV